MLPRILTAAAFLIGLTGTATASTITVSGVEVDSRLFADNAINLNFTGSSASGIIGTDFSTVATLSLGDLYAVSFANNTFENGDGFDLFIYESGNPEGFDVNLTLGGPSVSATLVNSDFSGTLSQFRVNTWGIELDDFGIAAGIDVGGFFVSNTGNAPELFAAAAVNGTPIPLPMSSVLLLGGLGMLGFARRRG